MGLTVWVAGGRVLVEDRLRDGDDPLRWGTAVATRAKTDGIPGQVARVPSAWSGGTGDGDGVGVSDSRSSAGRGDDADRNGDAGRIGNAGGSAGAI